MNPYVLFMFPNIVNTLPRGWLQDYISNFSTCSVVVRCTADACTEQKLAELQRGWKELMEQKTDEDKVYLATAVFDDLAQHSQYVSEQLQALLLAEAHYDSTAAAVLFFDMWDTIIMLYPDTEQLKVEVQYDAATMTELARVFYGNAPIIAKSIVK